MKVFSTCFWLPKAGNSVTEYEDAFYPKESVEHSAKQLRWAIADGASEGMLSGEWAAILVKIFCRSKGCNSDLNDLLAKAYANWNFWKSDYIRSRERRSKPIQWFEEPGLNDGAFSSLLGLTLFDDEDKAKWHAWAIGDSCLFQVRNDELVSHFPIEHSSDFDSRPLLISSNFKRNQELNQKVKNAKGDCQLDDTFYLMTDAIASWFLSKYENQDRPWEILRDFDTRDQHQSFEEWIGGLRKDKVIRNDDVTLIRLDVI